jgi:hypothetical protein
MDFIPCLIYPVNFWWIKGEIIRNTSWINTHKYNFFRPYSNILDPKNDTLDHKPMVQSLSEKKSIIDIFPISYENVGIMWFWPQIWKNWVKLPVDRWFSYESGKIIRELGSKMWKKESLTGERSIIDIQNGSKVSLWPHILTQFDEIYRLVYDLTIQDEFLFRLFFYFTGPLPWKMTHAFIHP